MGPQTATSQGTLLPPLDTDYSDTLLGNVLANGDINTAANNQRYGISVTYTEGKFIVASGTTGDESSLSISNVSTMAEDLLGVDADGYTVQAETSQINNLPAVRGQRSEPATVRGNQMGVDPRRNHSRSMQITRM